MVVMNTRCDVPAQAAEHPSQFLPLMLVLFIGSGCAALIYEIVWFQVLQLVIGSSAVSLAVLLGTFMRSEEHTSELQSPCNLVCRLLLEKKKNLTCRRPRISIRC